MLSNHLFWLAVVLLSWSAFSLNSAENFKGSSITQNILRWIGFGGMIAGIIRVVVLSITFNWWWLLAIAFGSFVIIGVVSALIRGFPAVILSLLGIIGIPVVWWMGGKF